MGKQRGYEQHRGQRHRQQPVDGGEIDIVVLVNLAMMMSLPVHPSQAGNGGYAQIPEESQDRALIFRNR